MNTYNIKGSGWDRLDERFKLRLIRHMDKRGKHGLEANLTAMEIQNVFKAM